MLDVKRFLDSPPHAIHQTCKYSQLIILNAFKYIMQKFLQFWGISNTWRIAKTCQLCFLRDYCDDSLDVMFPQFPNHFLLFPMVFPHVCPSVSTISSGVFTVSPQCFPCFLFQILRFMKLYYFKKDLKYEVHIFTQIDVPRSNKSIGLGLK